MDLTLGATHVSPNTQYNATSTYTFHVGPVSDLEVRDAGASPAGAVASTQRAFSIVAVNNGPDDAPAVEVTVSGLNAGDYVSHSATAGGFDPTTGVWTIGEMREPGYHQDIYGREGEVLTITTSAAVGSAITAKIENTQAYRVCIDSDGNDVDAASQAACTNEDAGNSWHTAKYLDHIPGNSTTTVAALPGTGRHPDAPQSLRVDKFASLALLRWQPPESGGVNGFGITHYQVERNGVTLADDVESAMYADLQGGAVNHSYRVRAVNSRGVPGPWSLPKGASGPLEQPEELGAPTGLTATAGAGVGRIDLSWFAPSTDNSLRYTIEHSPDGAGPWRALVRSQSGTTYSHDGLLSGTTHYYRVAALKGSVISAWAYVQETTEIVGDGAVYAPGRPEYLRFSSVERTRVTLVWDPPVDDGGSRITGYEYRVFGPCASGADAVCDIVVPTRVSGTSRSISGLNREGTYQFEVRALNAVGAGDWSQSVQKSVGPATAGGGRVVLSPSRLTVREGGEATYRVKLSRNPTLPVSVWLHWMGDEDLGGELPFQQGMVLLPSGYDTSGMSEDCHGYNYQDPEMTYAWNVGIPIEVVAAEDDDSENGRLTITHDIGTVPAECLGMTEDEWSPDPVYDGMFGIALEATERDND